MVGALALAGCSHSLSLIATADGGYAHALAQAPERSAAAVDGYIGLGSATAGDHLGYGLGGAIRTKWSDNVQQGSIAPFAYLSVGGGMDDDYRPRWAFFLIAGAALVTGEAIAGNVYASAGSPFGGLGFFLRIGTIGIDLTTRVEADVRFVSNVPTTAYTTFALGVMALTHSLQAGH